MKTVRIMSIIGLVLSAITLIVVFTYIGADTYEWADSAVGWGMILALFVVAQSIVGIVQSRKQNE